MRGGLAWFSTGAELEARWRGRGVELDCNPRLDGELYVTALPYVGRDGIARIVEELLAVQP